MPIFMDRHDVSDSVSAELVAQIHQEDLRIQDQFGCRGLTYWFDEKRKTAFCLIDAPHQHAIVEMHKQAHGEVPNQIIEVDPAIVESFLGRIEDPEKARDTKLNIINDPAFRTITIVNLETNSLKNTGFDHFQSAKQEYSQAVAEIVRSFDGRIVRHLDNSLLISFKSVSKAVWCALQIQSEFRRFKPKSGNAGPELKVALHAGVPVNNKPTIFEDTIKLAERMTQVSDAEIIVSSDVRELFKSENLDQFVQGDRIISLTNDDEKFLSQLMDFVEKNWQNSGIKVDDFNKVLGYSESHLYRRMIQLTGKSPNIFLLSYRLSRSLKLFQERNENIAEIAYGAGFNSPAYFSKCFRKKYGIIPSEYQAQTINSFV